MVQKKFFPLELQKNETTQTPSSALNFEGWGLGILDINTQLN